MRAADAITVEWPVRHGAANTLKRLARELHLSPSPRWACRYTDGEREITERQTRKLRRFLSPLMSPMIHDSPVIIMESPTSRFAYGNSPKSIHMHAHTVYIYVHIHISVMCIYKCIFTVHTRSPIPVWAVPNWTDVFRSSVQRKRATPLGNI